MPRACTVCNHAERSTIDQELADAISLRKIAQHYHVSKSSLLRHSQQCAPTVPQVAGHVAPGALAPCTCPCMRIPWDELAHDAQQLHAYMQQVQTQDEALYYMKFYLLRFAALIESTGAT